MNRNQVKTILMNFQTEKMRAKFMKSNGKHDDSSVRAFRSVEKCIDLLPDELQEIVKMLFIDGMSIRKCCAELHYGHTTVERKRDAAIEMIADCLGL